VDHSTHFQVQFIVLNSKRLNTNDECADVTIDKKSTQSADSQMLAPPKELFIKEESDNKINMLEGELWR